MASRLLLKFALCFVYLVSFELVKGVAGSKSAACESDKKITTLDDAHVFDSVTRGLSRGILSVRAAQTEARKEGFCLAI